MPWLTRRPSRTLCQYVGFVAVICGGVLFVVLSRCASLLQTWTVSPAEPRSSKCDVWSTKLSVSGDTISSLVSHGAVTACWDGEERLLPHGRRHAPEHLAQASLPQLFLHLLRLFGPVFLVGVSLRCCCAILLSYQCPADGAPLRLGARPRCAAVHTNGTTGRRVVAPRPPVMSCPFHGVGTRRGRMAECAAAPRRRPTRRVGEALRGG